ncbi:adenylate/guanylate cyclase domain-containing protein [uncultured Xylophilus sp.]|uniref:CHASE2 domain-containing protein n=1 Tax=uncultured Xylophilus sp. TaxID=296832 RepID=UPI0025F1AD22|nr:adenylate/guanylate cyclase domain-containing protein [uncultured Xylophilus sp.]
MAAIRLRRRWDGLARHRWRIAVTLLAVLVSLLVSLGVLPSDAVRRLDDMVYDVRLRATMPRTLDERIVIVDIDEESLATFGRWPWSRDKVARLVDELFERQQVAVVGFDVLFAEADDSSGLARLRALADGPLRGQPGFAEQLRLLTPSLDHDARFARALQGRPVVLGYYLTSDRDSQIRGVLPAPVLRGASSAGASAVPSLSTLRWSGAGGSLPSIAAAAPRAGYMNSINDADGLLRSVGLIADLHGDYHEALSLAMYRTWRGEPRVLPELVPGQAAGGDAPLLLAGLLLEKDGRFQSLPVDDRAAMLVPFRGPGGVRGGSYRYVSAGDLLSGHIAVGDLRDRLVLVGTTAPGLLDLRTTPVGEAYPGVETHANLLSAMLDGRTLVRPDYAAGYEATTIVLPGLVLAFALPFIGMGAAIALTTVLIAALVAANVGLFVSGGLVLPLALPVLSILVAFALNMGHGYFVESRSKRQLARLFGTYVPRELVDEMLRAPEAYSMQAENREMTVMFCDMRGFTALSERMEPLELQALLNDVFNRLSAVIQQHRGTIDKYIGDCVMAFWGAPVATPYHARLAVTAALEMVKVVEAFNNGQRACGLPEIGVGIGLNTGTMCVGDMGSDLRRSYTVVGDAVNLASRLEGLSKTYGRAVIASNTTHAQSAADFRWTELGKVTVTGRRQSVGIFTPEPLLEITASDDAFTLAA